MYKSRFKSLRRINLVWFFFLKLDLGNINNSHSNKKGEWN